MHERAIELHEIALHDCMRLLSRSLIIKFLKGSIENDRIDWNKENGKIFGDLLWFFAHHHDGEKMHHDYLQMQKNVPEPTKVEKH